MRMLRLIAVLIVLFTVNQGVFANIGGPKGNPHKADSLAAAKKTNEAGVGVQISRLGISAAEINPNYFKVARWDTLDIDMYHVDMTQFKDTLSYVFHRPAVGKEFHAPHAGHVTSGFGPRKLFGRKFHKGIDIDLDTGDEVNAAMSGKIRIARYSSGYGNFVVIAHEGGLETLYGHMSELWVEEGETVNAGQTIGLGGSTGQSTGSHLHFEIRVFGEQIDPERIVNPATLMPWNDEIKIDMSFFDHIYDQGGIEYHIVEEGETLDGICAMYEMDKMTFCAINQLTLDAAPKAGTRLRLE